MRLKMLVVASWYPSPASPVNGIFIAEQARALASRHDVTVLAPEVTPAGSRRARTVDTSGPYPVIHCNIPARRLVHHLDYARVVANEIRAGGFEVVNAHVTLPGGYAAVLAGIYTRRPVVITEHTSPFDELMTTARNRRKVRFALTRAAAVIAGNRGLEAKMRKYGITRPIQIIPNLIDTDRFALRPKPPRADDDYHLLFVGRLNTDQKNLPALLRAMSLLTGRGKRDGKGYRLKISGDGELRSGYEQMARELGVDEWCEFAGMLGPEQVARSLTECDVFVLPSLHENCPNVVAEAQAAGRPAVVTICGGSEELISPRTGKAVPVDDHVALADAIKQVCRNLDGYQPEEIAAYAKGRFGWEAVVDQLTEVYETVLGLRARPGVMGAATGDQSLAANR